MPAFADFTPGAPQAAAPAAPAPTPAHVPAAPKAAPAAAPRPGMGGSCGRYACQYLATVFECVSRHNVLSIAMPCSCSLGGRHRLRGRAAALQPLRAQAGGGAGCAAAGGAGSGWVGGKWEDFAGQDELLAEGSWHRLAVDWRVFTGPLTYTHPSRWRARAPAAVWWRRTSSRRPVALPPPPRRALLPPHHLLVLLLLLALRASTRTYRTARSGVWWRGGCWRASRRCRTTTSPWTATWVCAAGGCGRAEQLAG